MLLQTLLSANGRSAARQLGVFALLNLGLVESLLSGSVGVINAVEAMYHAENCIFVRKRLRSKIADEIMSRGVQLPDLFGVLPVEESHREFQRELAHMHGLCLKLLDNKQLVA